MPHRRSKPSIILGTVAAVAIASPLAVWGVTSTSGVQSTTESMPTVPTEIAEVVLAQVPDIVIPLKELTGLDLPDLRLSNLAKLPTEIPLPQNLPLPEGVTLPPSITLPALPGLPAAGDIAEPVPGAPAPAPAPAPPAPEQEFGTAVKEITRESPFSMIALTSDLGAAAAKIRARLADGSWGPWFATEPVDSRKNDRTAGGKTGTEPVFVGETNAVQVLVTKAAQALAAVPASGAADAPAPAELLPNLLSPADPAKPAVGFAPAALSSPLRTQDTAPGGDPAPAPAPETAPETVAPTAPAAPGTTTDQSTAADIADAVTAVLIQPGSGDADGDLTDIAGPVGGNGPKVITRAQWGADESIRCDSPSYDDSLGGATVHHTAGSNDYSRAESVEIVRSIYAYHARTLGWCDIGYNVLVDKYGQTFEGRAGGLDRNVQGAHAGGFNENTMGIAMMGDFSAVTPPQATVEAVGKFLGWRLGRAGLNPTGHTTMYSEGTEFTPFAQGSAVDLPVIFAHRDVGNTSCPGDAAYAKMGQIRSIAQANLGGSTGILSVAPDRTQSNKPPVNKPPASGTDPAGTPDSGTLLDTGSVDQSIETIDALVGELLKLTDQSPIAQKWISEGGELGRLGASLTGILPAKAGNSLVKFHNGAIATSPNGGTWSVLGKIYEIWSESGLDAGLLGLPTSDEYQVPDGKRTDFEFGSLIFNELTGAVTTVMKAYNEAYANATAGLPAVDAAAPVPAPAAAPAPAAPAPVVEALVPAA
ncbi:N-acetylmuramoyl-L-alanine amidase [Rhodococcus kronopolitis]|uniref:N-acetylmuramoyl-L-alanine amidase n=1 Tax=Rhodococcus kronopolitis TaxID=1460226 RepID=A0ABV9FYP5_9NOCA